MVWGVEKLLDRSQPHRHTLAELEYFDVVPDPEGSTLGPVVGTTEWGGLVVESGPMSVIIVLLPVIDETSKHRIPDARNAELDVDALIAVPHSAGGHIWRDEVAESFGVAAHDVFTLGDNFTSPIDSGPLVLEPHPAGVRIAWAEGERSMVIGYEIELVDLLDDETLIRIAGSLAATQDLEADGTDRLLERLRRVDLLGNVAPANAETALLVAAIDDLETIVTVDYPADYDWGVDFGIQWLFREITDGRWEALEEGREILAATCFASLVLELILSDRLDDAVRVADFGYQHIDPVSFAFDRGVLELMRGRREEARDWFLEAVEDEDFLEAEICLATLEDEPRALALLADYEDTQAQRWLEPTGPHLETVDELGAVEIAIRLSGLSYHAVVRANTFIAEESFQDAEGVLRRALDLDPRSTLALATLGEVMFADGRVDEAMELFDSADERPVSRSRLERARGRCLENVRRLGDAAQAYERALESAPNWDAARLDAIAVYAALANRSRGLEHVDYLAEHSDLDDQMLADLRAQFGG